MGSTDPWMEVKSGDPASSRELSSTQRGPQRVPRAALLEVLRQAAGLTHGDDLRRYCLKALASAASARLELESLRGLSRGLSGVPSGEFGLWETHGSFPRPRHARWILAENPSADRPSSETRRYPRWRLHRPAWRSRHPGCVGRERPRGLTFSAAIKGRGYSERLKMESSHTPSPAAIRRTAASRC